MTQLVEVKRIAIPTDSRRFDFTAAQAEVLDADARGDVVTAEERAIVIRTRVFIRRSVA